ncbi:hypothetical protein ACTXGU_00045 [Niallia sp. 01092]|uniref:hypothetical protein n=1 Tax=Niallia sp. 01092 TaxID=3457759 RepID=UPI003FD596C1
MQTVVDIHKVKVNKAKKVDFYKLEEVAKNLADENLESLKNKIKSMPQFPAEHILDIFSCNIINKAYERYTKEEILQLVSSGVIFHLKNLLDDQFYEKL